MNYNKICTNIEQSKYLLELGLNPETADMSYDKLHTIGVESGYCNIPRLSKPISKDDIPCWSLSALLDISPAIDLNKFRGKYKCDYLKDEWSNGPDYTTDFYKNPIDAVFEMVVWLLENRYIKTFKNKN